MGYKLEGELLEVCNCEVLCPCWIGENPDFETCKAAMAYHIASGTIDGVDVSGLTLGSATFIPGNVLDGNWRQVLFVDDRASDQQQQALLNAFRGRLGGPLADLAQLVGEVMDIKRVPITFTVEEGKGTLKMGDAVEAEMEPYRGPTGQPTTLNESIFTTIPGAPAYVARAHRYKMNSPELNMRLELQNHNAIQGYFRFET